jgi:hypothetical protein
LRALDEHEGELLILGNPGSGKTTVLLDLARTLLDRAEQDDSIPIPVLFQLASWAVKRRPLAEWMIEELTQPGGHDLPLPIARAWVRDDRILPLLDGLDEVRVDERASCVAAINEFQKQRTRASDLVVTSRLREYEALRPVLLEMRGAVELQPLGPREVDEFLGHGGARLETLRLAMASDVTLQEMASSPLLLSIMAMVFQGDPDASAPSGTSLEERRTQLFAAYVQTMFTRQGGTPPYTRDQTVRWLSWLGSSLTGRALTTFALERLQPDWLSTPSLRQWYAALDRGASALLVAVCLAVLFLLHFGPGLVLLAALVGVLVGGLIGGQSEAMLISRRQAPAAIRGALLALVVVGLASGSGVALAAGPGTGVAAAAIGGLVGAVGGGLAGGPGIGPRSIAIVERLRWSPLQAGRSALLGLGMGAAFGAVFGLIGVLIGIVGAGSQLQAIALSACLFGCLLAVGFGLVGGVVSGEIKERATPNQGIRRSARTAALAGLGFTLLAGLAFGLLLFVIGAEGTGDPTADFQGSLGLGIRSGLLIGPLLGLLAALAFGGYACLSHFWLRIVLWRTGVMPFGYVRFLEYAVECNFLYRQGGGYGFIHGRLQEYFAAQRPG